MAASNDLVNRRILIFLLSAVVATGAAVFAYREVRLRTVPTAAWQLMRHPRQMVLYSIDPYPIDPASPRPDTELNVFHNYPILGQTSVTTTTDQTTVDSAIRRSVASALPVGILCFSPRHGIRVTDGTKTYDFLACFECQKMLVFLDEHQIASTGIRGSPDALNSILRASNIPLAPLPNED